LPKIIRIRTKKKETRTIELFFCRTRRIQYEEKSTLYEKRKRNTIHYFKATRYCYNLFYIHTSQFVEKIAARLPTPNNYCAKLREREREREREIPIPNDMERIQPLQQHDK
jgi:hypothetical protein